MTARSVLFDAPGPRARRLIVLGNIVGSLVVLGVLAITLKRFADMGQLDGAKWAPLVESRAWADYVLPGLVNTLKAAAFAVVGAGVFGVVFGLGRLSEIAVVRIVSGTVVEFFRAVPVLLMMVFLYFGLGQMRILEPSDVPLVAVVVALMLYNGSVVAELIRSGVHNLPKGQREAGLAIGLTSPACRRLVEMPQALIAMLPALISQLVVVLKDSALGSIITYSELLHEARRLGSADGNILQTMLVAAVVFIVLNYALSVGASLLSRQLSGRTAGRTRSTPPSTLATPVG